MKIQIANLLKPFSHQPGTSCLIPGTRIVVKAYPVRLEIGEHIFDLPLKGPVQGFTVQQDLEKNAVFVFGRAKEGYFKYKIIADTASIYVKAEKGPIQSATFSHSSPISAFEKVERLSLGSHKKQDIDLIRRRSDLKEILPFLFFLGQKTPQEAPFPTALLVENRADLEERLLSFFKAGFQSLFVPRSFDFDYQGLSQELPEDPFLLLSEGAKNIRSLFFYSDKTHLCFLPHLPISFDAGRMIDVKASGVGTLSFEWSKKILKKVLIFPSITCQVTFSFQKKITGFRLNRKRVYKATDSICLKENEAFLLDRFTK